MISYPTAEWLAAGKTKIKFRGVEIGTVDEIAIDPSTKGVLLQCVLGARWLPRKSRHTVLIFQRAVTA